jgi:hypothetical protein
VNKEIIPGGNSRERQFFSENTVQLYYTMATRLLLQPGLAGCKGQARKPGSLVLSEKAFSADPPSTIL